MMEFGLFTVNQQFEGFRDLAQAAEGLGYGVIAFPDHFVQEGPEGQYDPHNLSYDPIITAATILDATRSIRVAPYVLCNLFRHPAVTARSLASLDRLGKGRIIAGIGAGWTATEFKMTGIAYPEIGTRLRMLDEALTCIRSLWTNERTNFSGEFYKLTDAILWPKPVQQPHPPILVGGSGRGLLRIAARHADIVNVISETGKAGRLQMASMGKLTHDTMRGKLDFVRGEARKLGRDPDKIAVSDTIFALTLTDSRKAAEQTAEGMAKAFGTTAAEVVKSPLALVGTPEMCIEEMKRRTREWGVSQFVFGGLGNEAALRRLYEQVLRHVG